MWKKKMKISIIIPGYNCENTISKCFESVINQMNGNDIEIIFINDGSTDKTMRVIEKYQESCEFLKVISKKNEGQGVARNVGIENASGDYVMFMDSDDFLENNCLNFIIKELGKNYDFYIFNWNYYNKTYVKKNILKEITIEKNEENKIEKFIEDYIYNGSEYSYGSAVWNKVYKLSIIKRNNIKFVSEREYLSEDMIFNLQYMKYINTLEANPLIIYNYVQSNQSFKKKFYKDYFDKYLKMADWLYDYDNNEAYKIKVNLKIFEYLKTILINVIYSPKNIKLNYKIKMIRRYIQNEYSKRSAEITIKYSNNKIDYVLSYLVKWKFSVLIYLLYSIKIKRS